jgi:hypothetical protein
MGRPRFQPTDATRAVVKALAAYGVPQPDIAFKVGCSHVTLRKHFGPELSAGVLEANSKVAERLFQDCLKPDWRFQASRFFWLKCRAGWRERVEVEAVGSAAELVARLVAGRQRVAKLKAKAAHA